MNCRLCSSPDTHFKFKVESFQPSFSIYECGRCGFQFQDVSPEAAYGFYTQNYYEGGTSFTYQDERSMEEASRIVWKARAKKLKAWDKSGLPQPRFLDVGCAFGGLMQVAEEYGYQAYGAEVSDFSGNYARERFGNDRVKIGSVETIDWPENYFSVITMIEVIEHLLDPAAAIRQLYRALAPGGVLLLQTADMAGLQALKGGASYHYYLPGHLSYFTRSNLSRLLLESGFERTHFFGGVEFGLLPKLRKSRHSFKTAKDYLRWWTIAEYHFRSKFVLFGKHLTSSMVMAAWKKK